MGIKKIKLISNNLCYGPEPAPTEEIEQHLTINDKGNVWFSARNYEQYSLSKGFCRKKQLSISKWKVDFLFSLIDSIEEPDFVTDCGDYELIINYDDGDSKVIYGSLIGNTVTTSYGSTQVDFTGILRRYIPVYALWGLDGSLSPDYEGKKRIHLFAKKWEKKFLPGTITTYEFEEFFGTECIALGFNLAEGEEFKPLHPKGLNDSCFNIEKVVSNITDIDLLGCAIFSEWRYLTHWSWGYQLDENTCQWFRSILKRIKELTSKK